MTLDSSVKNNIIAEVKHWIENLQSMSFADLQTLPEADVRALEVDGAPIIVTLYRIDQPGGDLMIVVQASRQRFLGICHNVWVEGFVVSTTGTKSKASENLLWDFT